jgi:hypothetical protein
MGITMEGHVKKKTIFYLYNHAKNIMPLNVVG